MRGPHGHVRRYVTGSIAVALLLVGARVAAECIGDEHEHIPLTLESVTVDGQPQNDLLGYQGWTVEIRYQTVSQSQPQRVQFTASQVAADKLCDEDFRQ